MFEQLFDPANYTLSHYSFPAGIVGLINLAVGIFVFFKNRHSLVSLTFFVFAFDLFIWLMGFAIMFSMNNEFLAYSFVKNVAFIGVIGIAPCFYFLSAAFVGKLAEKKFVVATYFIVGVVFCFLLGETNFLIVEVREYFWGRYPVFHLVGGALLFLPYFIFVASSGFLLLFKRLAREKNTEKSRIIKIVMVSMAIAFVASVDHLPGLGLEIYPFGYIPITIYSFVIAYVVVRFGVLEITSTIASSTIVQAIPDVLLVTDTNNNIVFSNKNGAELLGYKIEELVNMSLLDIIEKDQEVVFLNESRKTDFNKGLKFDLLSQDNKKVPVSISAAEIMISGKKNIGKVVVAKDMRKMNDLVESLKNNRSELKQKVGELEHFNKITIDRELRMIELKKKINALEEKKSAA